MDCITIEQVPSQCKTHIDWAYNTGRYDVAKRNGYYPSALKLSTDGTYDSMTYEDMITTFYCDSLTEWFSDCKDILPACDSNGNARTCPIRKAVKLLSPIKK